MPAKCDNTLPGTDSRVIGQYLLQSVRGPLPLYRVIILPSCQSAGTMPDLHTWINRTYYKFIRSVQTHAHTRLTALLPGLPGWAGTRKVKPIWILLAVASAGPYASLHLAPER